ncbi:chondroadherin-like [Patiria miniata]|uniref:Uncharacterized protein n=1 Tax=Patiria miniata TaxID=46514 RepID=A0A914AV56_PATMI|nr:chondroadherin-like [Patiria miniata]
MCACQAQCWLTFFFWSDMMMEITTMQRFFFFFHYLVLTAVTQPLVPQAEVLRKQICDICMCSNETGVTTANCRNSNLNELELESAVYGDIHTLNLSHLNLRRVPMVRAPELSVLDLSNNQISDFSRSDSDVEPLLEDTPSLITNGPFENLGGLRDLDVSFNRLSNLTREMLTDLGNLETLNISHNEIRTTDADAFADLTKLVTLRLNHNLLTEVPSAISNENFRQTLEDLSLSANPIRALRRDAFSRLIYLHVLDLSRMELDSVHPNAFQGVTAGLQELYLHTNRLQTLSAQTIQGLDDLTMLSLHENPWVCNCTLTKLTRYLETRRNNINVLQLDSTYCTSDDGSKTYFTSQEIDAFCESFPLEKVIPAAIGAVILIIATAIIATCCCKKRRQLSVQQMSPDHTNRSTINMETSIRQSYFQRSTLSPDDNLSSLEASTRSEHIYCSIKSQQPLVYTYADARKPENNLHSADGVEYQNAVCPKNEKHPQSPKSDDGYLVPSFKQSPTS